MEATQRPAHAAYYAALAAECAWVDQIKIDFPYVRPGDFRYTREAEGKPGSALRAKHEAFQAATSALVSIIR